jgi:DNA invertase Pin-like site-specific DNA recombinase
MVAFLASSTAIRSETAGGEERVALKIIAFRLVDCLNNIRTLEDHGIRFIAVTQGQDTDWRNPASQFLLHVLGAAAEFERSLIRERTQAGRLRYRQGRWGRPSIADRERICPGLI